MDFTPVIAQVWGMLIWFIPAAMLLCLLKSPWPKGHIGANPDHLHSVINFVDGSTFITEVSPNVLPRIGLIAISSHSSSRYSASLKSTPYCKPAATHRPSPQTVSPYKTSSAVAIRLPSGNALNAVAPWLFALVKQGPMSASNSGAAQPLPNAKSCRAFSTQP